MKPEAPGWYPDESTGKLRRWDGRRWTGETRERPPWAPGSSTEPNGDPMAEQLPPRRRIGRHWLALGVVVALAFIGVSIKAWTTGANLPPRTVFDEEFITAANAKCRETLKPLKDKRPEPGSAEGRDPGPAERVAAQVDETADALVDIAAELRRIPVRPEAEAAVTGWLNEWDLYADIGHRYADAVRDEAPRQEGLIKEGAASSRRADGFARANRLTGCTLA